MKFNRSAAFIMSVALFVSAGLLTTANVGSIQPVHAADITPTLTTVIAPATVNLDYSPRYWGHEIASGRSESNVWIVANTD